MSSWLVVFDLTVFDLTVFEQLKKCDDQGRNVMLRELEAFGSEIAKLTVKTKKEKTICVNLFCLQVLRPLPMFERTKAYVNAYFQKAKRETIGLCFYVLILCSSTTRRM
jgi:hypothetical protein